MEHECERGLEVVYRLWELRAEGPASWDSWEHTTSSPGFPKVPTIAHP